MSENKKEDKAYKILAIQEGISNSKAKALIDRGVVYSGGRQIKVARADMDTRTVFRVDKIEKTTIMFQDDNILVVDKPAFKRSDEIEKEFGYPLLHRLDQQTSGVLVMCKNEEFREAAIAEFKADRVYKEYSAWVEGIIIDNIVIDKPILTQKGSRAVSKVSTKGKPATTEVFVDEVIGKRSKVKVVIHEGRTHQIRVHMRSIGHPVVGDEQYGGKNYKRIMLHAKKFELFDYKFESHEPKIFGHIQG